MAEAVLLRQVMDRQSLPIRLSMLANPQATANLLARWMHAGVPIDALALHFDRDWLIANYGNWLWEQCLWFAANGLSLIAGSPEAWAEARMRLTGKPVRAPGNWALLKPLFREFAWCRPTRWIQWDTKLPQETYGRRAISELATRIALKDALRRMYERNPELWEAHRRHPNNPEWEKRNPERDIFRDWVVDIFQPASPEERQMLGWQPGDTWRDVIRRQIEFLERYGGGAGAAEARDKQQDA